MEFNPSQSYQATFGDKAKADRTGVSVLSSRRLMPKTVICNVIRSQIPRLDDTSKQRRKNARL